MRFNNNELVYTHGTMVAALVSYTTMEVNIILPIVRINTDLQSVPYRMQQWKKTKN